MSNITELLNKIIRVNAARQITNHFTTEEPLIIHEINDKIIKSSARGEYWTNIDDNENNRFLVTALIKLGYTVTYDHIDDKHGRWLISWK